jgi:cytochrome c oxidase cbb3-type subunit 2
LAAGLLTQARAEPRPANPVEFGREVYVAEGCINCHSQYVRPETSDSGRWGPQRTLAESLELSPPLLGNRRQGPDLQNVANRRARAWQRLHLQDPRAVTPGSRMPAYAHLFAGDAARGEALLDYLDSLGGETWDDHWQTARTWSPSDRAVAAPGASGLFVQWCATCHGADGQGRGALASRLPAPPRNLVANAWRFVDPAADTGTERLNLARTIKYGVPGTTMAGHEYLSDAEVLALADYIQGLRRTARVASGAVDRREIANHATR